MEKEKAEIARLVEKYGRVQSLMKYVNSDTHQGVLPKAAERESGRNRRDKQRRIRKRTRRKY